jgi:hypothetical protein
MSEQMSQHENTVFHKTYYKEIKLHIEELHNLYSSPSIITMTKSRGMGWAGHVARMRRRGRHIGFWQESQKERYYYEDQNVDGRKILRWILGR